MRVWPQRSWEGADSRGMRGGKRQGMVYAEVEAEARLEHGSQANGRKGK